MQLTNSSKTFNCKNNNFVSTHIKLLHTHYIYTIIRITEMQVILQ